MHKQIWCCFAFIITVNDPKIIHCAYKCKTIHAQTKLVLFKVLLRWCQQILFECDYDQLFRPNIHPVSLSLEYMIYTLMNNVYISSNDKCINHKLMA